MFDQSPFECRVEWGQRGARDAADRGDIVIVVDVLSFSSTVVTAFDYGAIIYPYPPPLDESAIAYAEQINAQIVWGRAEAIKFGGRSLSPVSYTPADNGQKFLICSLNGAACARIANKAPALLVGCPLNASAVADTANKLRDQLSANITVIPCGETWSDALEDENRLRPGVEDYLGAGLIVSKLNGTKSAEAQVCAGAFEWSKSRFAQLIWESGSGRELCMRGYEQDVAYSSQIDISRSVPLAQEDRFVNASTILGK